MITLALATMRRGLVRVHHGGGNDLREVTAEVFQMRFSGVLDQVEGGKGRKRGKRKRGTDFRGKSCASFQTQ